MVLIGLIIVCVIFVVLLSVLLITLLNGKHNTKNDMFIDGGYNVDTGLKENISEKIFVGVNKNLADTHLVNEAHREKYGITVYIYDITGGKVYRYKDISEIIIGRDLNRSTLRNYLYIGGDNSISKLHCRIKIINNGVMIEDMNSSNHTYINSKKINCQVKVNPDDVIKIGRTKLKVKI